MIGKSSWKSYDLPAVLQLAEILIKGYGRPEKDDRKFAVRRILRAPRYSRTEEMMRGGRDVGRMSYYFIIYWNNIACVI